MKKWPIYSSQEMQSKFAMRAKNAKYRSYFSSWAGGICCDSEWLLIPVDDHMVHRGDGVFEALKFMNRKIYLLEAHLARLLNSAEKIGLKMPLSKEDLAQACLDTCRASRIDHGNIRIFVSRGGGNFSPNPYDTNGSHLYIVVTDMAPPTTAQIQEGVSAIRAQWPAKEGLFAQVKSCNYLPNVMMKKQAVEEKADFAISFDRNSYLTEGPTENILVMTKDDVVLHPDWMNTLRGTTTLRLLDIMKGDEYKKSVKKVQEAKIKEDDVVNAKEAWIIGTTLDVLSVVSWNHKPVCGGKPGPVGKQLLETLRADQRSGPFLTEF